MSSDCYKNDGTFFGPLYCSVLEYGNYVYKRHLIVATHGIGSVSSTINPDQDYSNVGWLSFGKVMKDGQTYFYPPQEVNWSHQIFEPPPGCNAVRAWGKPGTYALFVAAADLKAWRPRLVG